MKQTREISVKRVQRIAEVLKTIGHPLRLQIMEALEKEEPLCVSDLQERIKLDVEQSLLSHHLIKMKDKGILTSEKRGMNVFYGLKDRYILSIFDCMENCPVE